jgi:adenylate cyclase
VCRSSPPGAATIQEAPLRLPLRLKLSLLITALLTVTVLLVSGFLLRTQQRTLSDEMRKRGLTLAQNLGAGARTALLTQDDFGLQSLVRDVARDADVAYVAVTDSSGRVVAHSDLALLGRPLERPGSPAPPGEAVVVQTLPLAGHGDVLDFSVPLTFRDVRVGTAYVGFSQAGIVQAVGQARTRASAITLAMLTIGVAGALGLAAALARPIVRLMEATRTVAGGDFSVELPVTTRDELGTLTAAFNDMARSLREKEMIKRAFSRYVAREVVDEILKDPEQLNVTGERREVTVLFCDIRGFTATAEALSPEAVVELLNAFYDLMIETTFKHDGTLDKFLGDGVMAVFGAPLYRPDHALMAARTALAMQAAIRELSARRVAAGQSPLAVGIGLNAGEVIAGTIGSDARMEYTVVGDSVNLAARLESCAGPGQILVSAETYARLDGAVRGRPLGRFNVKGRDEAVAVCELLAGDA